MDILNIINNFLEEKDLEIKKDIKKIVNDINSSNNIKIIAKGYNITEEELKHILNKHGYRLDEHTNKWELNGNGNNNKSINQDVNSIKTEQTKENFKENSNYSVFFKKVIENEEQELKNIVRKLNNGNTLYDVSKDYVKNRKDRGQFATKLKYKLEDKGYFLDNKSKKWIFKNFKSSNEVNGIVDIKSEKSSQIKVSKSVDIDKIVSDLNGGKSFDLIQKEYDTSNQHLRLLLKKKGYMYDGLLKYWSKMNKRELLEQTAKQLLDGKICFSEIKKRGVNIEFLKNKFDLEGLQYEASKRKDNENSNKLNFDINSTESQPSLEHAQYGLTEDEISTLKNIIFEWKEKQKSDSTTRISIRLRPNVQKQLEDMSFLTGFSESLIIEEALINYFKKKDNGGD